MILGIVISCMHMSYRQISNIYMVQCYSFICIEFFCCSTRCGCITTTFEGVFGDSIWQRAKSFRSVFLERPIRYLAIWWFECDFFLSLCSNFINSEIAWPVYVSISVYRIRICNGSIWHSNWIIGIVRKPILRFII